MSGENVLIIDDEPDIRELLSITLKRMGLIPHVAANFNEAINKINHQNFLLVLTDMKLPDGDGIDIIHFIQQKNPQMPVAVITAFGNVENAVETLKAGAFDYVSKPINVEMLKSLVEKALLISQKPETELESLLGESEVMQALRQNIQKLARSQAPVFIHGASGVGKELVARLIHHSSPRADKPFIAVNCGAIPGELMESEFFGHKKGSFTGAYADKEGLFAAASGGTLFLDEVAELPVSMQVKLLRAIQEKAIKPIGELHEKMIDVRILSASNKNLQEEIKQGHFRQELYYRINVIELRVPTLKERRTDIPLLAESILNKIALEQNRKTPKLSKASIDALKEYDFPGNVRELENILERAITLCDGAMIHPKDLQLPQKNSIEDFNLNKENLDLDESLQAHERELIINALEKTKWNRTKAAKLLGLSFRALRYRLKKLGID